MANHYETLNLKPTATAAQIRAAHRALARALHPDVNKAKDAAGAFAAVQTAYEVLSDPAGRARYDAALRSAALPPPSLEPHYDFTNIASRGPTRRGPRGRGRPGGPAAGRPAARPARSGDPTGFDELYDAFFATRPPGSGADAPHEAPTTNSNARSGR